MQDEIESKQTKACPFCGEVILAVAIKCKHCKSDLAESATSPDPPCRQCGTTLVPAQQCPKCKAVRSREDAAAVAAGAPCRQDGTPLIDILQCPTCRAVRSPLGPPPQPAGAGTMQLKCPTCGVFRAMTSTRKATGTAAGCAMFAIWIMFGVLGIFFWPLWIICLVFLVLGIYFSSQAERVWQCPVCKVEIKHG